MAARFSRQAVGAWPITLGTRHQIYAFESLPVPEVAKAAVGGSRVPWSTARWRMLFWLIEPACYRLSYPLNDNLVLYAWQLFVDTRDLKCLHGQMGSGRAGAQGAILYRREWNG